MFTCATLRSWNEENAMVSYAAFLYFFESFMQRYKGNRQGCGSARVRVVNSRLEVLLKPAWHDPLPITLGFSVKATLQLKSMFTSKKYGIDWSYNEG